MKEEFRRRFDVSYLDIDFRGKLKAEALINQLMEAAAGHAIRMGVSVADLMKQNLTWVLSRYHIAIDRWPGLGEAIDILTWPSRLQETFALRDFEASDPRGIFARATSSWLVLSLAKKKAVKIRDHLAMDPSSERRALDDDFEPLLSLQHADLERELPVFMCDIDVNRHVNSTVFIRWALESVPEDVLFNLKPGEIEIHYRNEAFYGDRIISRVQELRQPARAFLHQLCRCEDEVELARLQTVWAEI